MTLHFAPPGEPLDGDNWQEISEAIVEIEPEFKAMSEQRFFVSKSETRHFEFEPSPEFMNAVFGYDVYALNATVADWLSRPAYPIPPIKSVLTLFEMQDRINRIAIMLHHIDSTGYPVWPVL